MYEKYSYVANRFPCVANNFKIEKKMQRLILNIVAFKTNKIMWGNWTSYVRVFQTITLSFLRTF